MLDIELVTSGEHEARRERLHRVIGYVVACAETAGDDYSDVYNAIDRLEDDKGLLIVTWSNLPTKRRRDWFIRAWSNVVAGDGSNAVRHCLKDEEAA